MLKTNIDKKKRKTGVIPKLDIKTRGKLFTVGKTEMRLCGLCHNPVSVVN